MSRSDDAVVDSFAHVLKAGPLIMQHYGTQHNTLLPQQRDEACGRLHCGLRSKALGAMLLTQLGMSCLAVFWWCYTLQCFR